MASLRKGHCYSPVKRAYTRKSKYKGKGFIKAIPTSKIIRYDMGDIKKTYGFRVDLVSKQPIQVRHNALESSRQIINRHFNLSCFNFLVNHIVWPFHNLPYNFNHPLRP